jgi:hypothetical protein
VWTFEELNPRWRASTGHRYQTGLSFACPVHELKHRLRVMLSNPSDGEPPEFWPASVLAHRDGRTIGELTLTHPTGGHELHFGMCGWLRIYADGRDGRTRVDVVL